VKSADVEFPALGAEPSDDLNGRHAAALASIAEHRPVNESLLHVCRLLDQAMTGARTVVARRSTDDNIDLLSVGDLPAALRDEILDRVRDEFSRIEQRHDDAVRFEFSDPTAPDTRSVWCLAITGLGGRPIAALCVSRDWPEATERTTGAFDHAALLVQVAIEQSTAAQNFAATIAAERQEIANQLHDDPVQSITVLSLMLQRLARDLPDEHQSAVREARAHADHAIARMRRMLFDLHPSILEEDGLAVAIEIYLEETMDPLDIRWTLDDRLSESPDHAIATLAFRLAHEALANVATHSEATEVAISLDDSDDTLRITVADNGTGFDPSTIPPHRPGHLGLSNVRYLARRSAGTFDISSAPGGGCTVDIRLPLNHALNDVATE
jgi:signal transduction histidine kinase